MRIAPSSLLRTGVPLIALVLTAGASAPEAVPPEPVPGTLNAPAEPEAACRDRIELVRQERGLPKLQRDTADPDEAKALMILAVDREIDGCDVLVMASDPRDVRPLPQFDPEDWRVRPAPHRSPYRPQ